MTDTVTGNPTTDPHTGPFDLARPRVEADVADAPMVAAGARIGGPDATTHARRGPGEPASVAAHWCGCGMTVSQWTGRESRALREALRMSLRAFAEHPGVSNSTVSGWENRNPTPLRLATQAVLDQALTLADADTKTRFGLILASVPDGTSGTGADKAHSAVGRSMACDCGGLCAMGNRLGPWSKDGQLCGKRARD